MKKYDKNAEKLSDKAFSHFVFMSLLTIIICIFGLCGATYAWFVASTDSNDNVILSGKFELDISVTDPLLSELTPTKNADGTTDFVLGAGTTYNVTLDASDETNVSKGYCVVTIGDEVYNTDTIYKNDEPFTFTVNTGSRNVRISFETKWGSARTPDIQNAGEINLNSPIITNEEFTYGSYLDGGSERKLSGSYGLLRAADAVLINQDITIRVIADDYTNYKVTLAYYSDAEGKNYTGKTGILPMTDGVIQIPATSIKASFFRVNVMIYPPFTKVPESAIIEVYGGTPPISNGGDNGNDNEGGNTGGDNGGNDSGEATDKKTVSIIGDSISTGGYPSVLAGLLNANIDNNAISGTRITGNGFASQLSGIDKNSDLIIIFGGTNDYWHKNANIGNLDSTDTNTFIGALKYIINYLKENHPDAEYLFVFPADQTFQGNNCTTDFGKGTFADFREAFMSVCAANGVYALDLEASSDYDCSVHSGDGVHPNSAGHSIIANAIYKYVKENIEQ